MQHIHKDIKTVSLFDYTISGLCFATALISGITFAYSHHWLAACTVACLLGFSYLFKAQKKDLLLIVLLFFAGYARLQYTIYSYNKIIANIKQNTPLVGTIEAIEKAQTKRYSYLIQLSITHYLEDDIQVQCNPWILQCYAARKPRGQVGDLVCISNAKISTRATDSFADYLKKEGIHATAFLSTYAMTILHSPSYSFARTMSRMRNNLFERIQNKCSSSTGTLIAAIFFGNRLAVKNKYLAQKDMFCNWGIIHFLARSGLHLVIFVLFLQLLLRWIPLRFMYRQSLIIIATLLYIMLSWQSVSFARACFSFAWYRSCHILGLQVQTVHIIIMLSCLFLLCNPMLIFFLDFQLSFGITLVLAIINQCMTIQKLPIR